MTLILIKNRTQQVLVPWFYEVFSIVTFSIWNKAKLSCTAACKTHCFSRKARIKELKTLYVNLLYAVVN